MAASESVRRFCSAGPYAVSCDGSFLICACDGIIKVIDSSNAAVKSTIEGDSDPVTAFTLKPDDSILFSASHNGHIRVWDLSSRKCIRSWKGHEGPVMGMACHASGGLLATAGEDKKVQVWYVDGGFSTHCCEGHEGVVTSVVFHPDPNRLLLFSGGDDAMVKVWDLRNQKCAATLEKHRSTVTSIAISEDGWTLLTAGRDKVVNIWNLHDYSCQTTVPTYEALEAVCTLGRASPLATRLSSFTQKNGKKKISSSSVLFITVGERGIVRIWNSDGGVLLFEQKSSDLAFSPDNEEVERGFTSATLLPLDRGLLCATVDHQLLIYVLDEDCDRFLMIKSVIEYKFLGEEEQLLAVATSVEQTYENEILLRGSSGVARYPEHHSLLSSEHGMRLKGTTIVIVRLSRSRLLIGVDSRTTNHQVDYELLVSDSVRKYKVFRKNIFMFYSGFIKRARYAIQYVDRELKARKLSCNIEVVFGLAKEFFKLFPPDAPNLTVELLLCGFWKREKKYEVYRVGDNLIPMEMTQPVFGTGSGSDSIVSRLKSKHWTVDSISVDSVSAEMLRTCTICPYTGGKIRVFSLDEDCVLKKEYKSSFVLELLKENPFCTELLFHDRSVFVVIRREDERSLNRLFLAKLLKGCGGEIVFCLSYTEAMLVYAVIFSTAGARKIWFEQTKELDYLSPDIGFGELNATKCIICAPKLSMVKKIFCARTLEGFISGHCSI